jgi:hypothetical protein
MLDGAPMFHFDVHVTLVDDFVVDQYDRRDDLDVQVKLGPRGLWHKKAIGGNFTACGIPLGGYATRAEDYRGTLCPTCFTAWERRMGIAQPPDPNDTPKNEGGHGSR